MHWMILPLRRYAEFEGRSRRTEYWLFTLFLWLVAAAYVALGFAVGVFAENGRDPSPLTGVYLAVGGLMLLGIIIPSLAVTVRRLHDSNKSGWFYLISFIPYVGGLILFIFTVLPGTPGPNDYGDDPRDPTEDASDLEEAFR